jgi:hypothetical protein
LPGVTPSLWLSGLAPGLELALSRFTAVRGTVDADCNPDYVFLADADDDT